MAKADRAGARWPDKRELSSRIFGRHLPAAPTPRGARSIQRILDAAARLFGKEGFQGASMLAVARAAGVSKGLLHYHFRSKDHLLIEAQRATFRQIYRRFDGRFQKGDVGLDTSLEAFDALYRSIRDMRAWAPFMVETMSLGSHDGPVREHLDIFYAEAMELLENGIRDVLADRAENLAFPPDHIAAVVKTTLHGLVVELAYARTQEDVERIDTIYADFRQVFGHMATTPAPGAEHGSEAC